jgi:superfamily II DNA or RNA helicase
MTVQTASTAYDIKPTNDDFATMEMTKTEFFKYMEENLEHVNEKKEEIKKLIENAAGIYSDEVHHFSAKSCEKIISRSKKSYYKFGGTATAIRADNSYLVIEGLFGRKTAQITASDLIKLGYLLRPEITFVQMDTQKQIVTNYHQDYDKHIMNNEERNNCVVEIAKKAYQKELTTMILIKNIKHGKELKKLIDYELGIDVPFVHGSTKKDIRSKMLEDLRNGQIKMMIASTICDEGLDVPSLSCLIMASGGKSPTKAKQRIGRVIRLGSPFAFVYDFVDVGRWTKKHSRDRMKILKEESEFDIKTIQAKNIKFI